MFMKIADLLKMCSAPAAAILVSASAIAQVPALSQAPEQVMRQAAAARQAVTPKAVADDETIFTYAPNGTYNYYRASSSTEPYNMAIRIADNTLVGAKVVGLCFDLASTNVTDVSGWVTTELAVSGGENVITNGTTASLNTLKTGTNEIRFSEPVEITSEGVYVGYSLTLTSVGSDDYPIAVGSESDATDYCFLFLPNSFGNVWYSHTYVSLPYNLSMQVILTDVQTSGIGITLPDYVISKPGETSTCTVTTNNYSGQTITSIEYDWEVAGESGTYSVSTEIANTYGASASFSLTLPAVSEVGEYELAITVTKVNGEDNPNAETVTTTLYVTETDIKHRAVMEEYTGTWCGYCPRGYIAMKRLNAAYPDDFIGLAYHYADAMDATNVTEPQSVSGYPACYLDRATDQLDPYHGSSSDWDMVIEDEWLERCNVATPVGVELSADLSLDGETVEVTSEVTFIMSIEDADYSIAYALVADSLSGTGSYWTQTNYFTGYSNYYTGDDWEVFTRGSSAITGLEFDDVVILAPDIRGVSGSIPSEITAEETIYHSYTFTLSQAKSLYTSESLVQNVNNLRVVAMVLNANGEIINANKAAVYVDPSYSSVSNIAAADSAAVEVARYSIDGRKLAEPERGVNIVKMSDGTAYKELVK